ncbi:MAG: hypothetical protein GEU90_13050 [Gemmatimonas sp.]|nr:hypothetical protein [Gemmatimonas sp.]
MLEVSGEGAVDRFALLGRKVTGDAELLPRPVHDHSTEPESAGRREIELSAHQADDLTQAGFGTEFDSQSDAWIDVGMIERGEDAANLVLAVPRSSSADPRGGELLPFPAHLLAPGPTYCHGAIDPFLDGEPLGDLQEDHDAALGPRRTTLAGFREPPREP